ncbi:hypothetical protein [Candidatus Nitronereus thalassa]|uniref:Uncharacterized protein n=1 Tax=Candidatus Nitronereus thalassa TaxID=3020898 RepID=A0ABU3K4A0_9BACT|nr:hypothetical protein [Candidatus Nitronereus thalassa]MDT7041208.1 hypothetical protein [Candidatus Nitronereus thalassa]
MDHVTTEFFNRYEPEIQGFLQNILRLGEPFVTGFNRIEAITSEWRTLSQEPAAILVEEPKRDHPIFHHYRFSVLSPKN